MFLYGFYMFLYGCYMVVIWLLYGFDLQSVSKTIEGLEKWALMEDWDPRPFILNHVLESNATFRPEVDKN